MECKFKKELIFKTSGDR